MFDWITGLLEQLGVVAVGFLMLAENIFPPIPSELIMPLAGFLVYQGKMRLIAAVISGSIGSLLGTYLWYLVARRIGRERVRRLVARHGKWLTVSLDDLDRASDWFERHGRAAVVVGRMIPGIRTVISVPAGLTGMKHAPFLMYSLLGTTIWTALLTCLGYALGSQYDKVAEWLNLVTTVLLLGALALYVYRLVTHKGAEDAKERS
ncbi:DedA family protein [Pelagivirga sediminicola]|uniref:DedA family protein n=1 Tax=Pelagivirga sediminicola TaxID=2170575 RepID=A0A2T7G887_9RHOB|nr:DedA family protein [Pelagivirga sediminicola]PVA10642.1 DedA family protein [Pelagivirga sediminicola]